LVPRWFKTLVVLMALIAPFAARAEGETCTCLHAGVYYAEGECACITISGNQRYACCGRVLNNSAWKFQGSCPIAANELETDRADVKLALARLGLDRLAARR